MVVTKDRQHRNGAPKIVGYQQESAGRMGHSQRWVRVSGTTVLSSFIFPSFRLMANALTVPSLCSPTRSVSLAEYRQVPEEFRARQLGLVPISWIAGRRHLPGSKDLPEKRECRDHARGKVHGVGNACAQRRAEGSNIGRGRGFRGPPACLTCGQNCCCQRVFGFLCP